MALSILWTIGLAPAWAHLPAAPTQNSLSPMIEKATPAVVNITVERLASPMKPNQMAPTKIVGVGSGVILDSKKGYVVTNAHLINHQALIIVTLKDGRRYRANVIGKDDDFDLAVLQIHGHHLTDLPVADSNRLKVGDFVIAVGSPFGLTQTVTSGMISALNRSEPRIDNFQSFIQTDASINPGNSGGALINLNGELIGINTAIVTPGAGNIGIGFAIPSNMMKSVVEQLIRYGKVERGMLGVMAQNITPELADAMHLPHDHGAIVTNVLPDTPAKKAGIQVEDIIEAIDDISIDNAEQLHNTLGLIRPKTLITVHVLRHLKKIALKATVAPAQGFMPKQEMTFFSGMRLQNFTDLEPDGTVLRGVLILSVEDSSAGALAGLTVGDLILNANGKEVTTVADLLAITQKKPQRLLLKIFRNSEQIFIVIQSNA